MHIELMAQPASAAAKITLAAGESITAETGAMIAMSKGLNVQTTSRQRGGKGGMMKGLKRAEAEHAEIVEHCQKGRIARAAMELKQHIAHVKGELVRFVKL